MKKTLILRKMGANFAVFDNIKSTSNCENYRLRAKNILSKQGTLIETVDFIAGLKFTYKFKNGKTRKKPKLITKYHLFARAEYKTLNEYKQEIYKRHKEIENEAREGNYLYTLEDILKCVNAIANVPYTDIEII